MCLDEAAQKVASDGASSRFFVERVALPLFSTQKMRKRSGKSDGLLFGAVSRGSRCAAETEHYPDLTARLYDAIYAGGFCGMMQIAVGHRSKKSGLRPFSVRSQP